jgi:hypothetical protein
MDASLQSSRRFRRCGITSNATDMVFADARAAIAAAVVTAVRCTTSGRKLRYERVAIMPPCRHDFAGMGLRKTSNS